MDITTAFLNGVLDEGIYMEQPQGYKVKGKEDLVCRLLKAHYGLKQSPRRWNIRLDKFLRQYGFVKATSDPNLYILQEGDQYMLLLVYVDDLLLATNSKQLMDKTKVWLKSEFEMQDIGEPTYCLGMEIKRNRKQRTLTISQSKYIYDSMKKFGMQSAHGVATPISTGVKLTKVTNEAELKASEQLPYKQVVGTLIFLTCLTRCDIAYVVHLVSQYLSCYGQDHWVQAKRILRYLKETSDYCITYRAGGEFKLLGHTDSDWASDLDSRKSLGAYIFTLAGGPVS